MSINISWQLPSRLLSHGQAVRDHKGFLLMLIKIELTSVQPSPDFCIPGTCSLLLV